MGYKKEVLLSGAIFACVIFIEFFVFNQGFMIDRTFNLQERRYSLDDGSLYQFDLKNGKLIARTNDPNITFDNI